MKMTKILIGVLLGLQFSCNNVDKSSKTKLAEKIKVENEGVNIDYDDSKIGDTTLLFIHGWDIDRTYWSNQFDFFSKKNRVIAIDLPGFGKSGKNRKSWTVEEYGKDITAVLIQLNLKKVILIGHSMSGAIAVEAAINNPTRIIGVVGVDNFKNFNAVQSPQEKENIANAYKSLRTNYIGIAIQYANQYLFSPSTDSIIRKRVINDFTNADSNIAVNCLEQGDKYPADEKLKSFNKVIYLINSDFTPTDTLAFRKNMVAYYLLNIGPTGHYPMIEKPNEFNSLLEQVIKEIGK